MRQSMQRSLHLQSHSRRQRQRRLQRGHDVTAPVQSCCVRPRNRQRSKMRSQLAGNADPEVTRAGSLSMRIIDVTLSEGDTFRRRHTKHREQKLAQERASSSSSCKPEPGPEAFVSLGPCPRAFTYVALCKATKLSCHSKAQRTEGP
eukprot:6489955-Amphidinium_carterae.1